MARKKKENEENKKVEKEVKETQKEKEKDTKQKEITDSDLFNLPFSSINQMSDWYQTHNRIIYVNDNISEKSAKVIINQILALDAILPGAPITLVLMSTGGSVWQSIGIVDVMNTVISPIYTVALGFCMSAATYIHAHGEKGHRYTYPGTEFLLHPMKSFLFGDYKTVDLETEAKYSKELESRITDRMVKRGNSKMAKKIREHLTKESFLTAEEYKKLGLVDQIITKKSGVISSRLHSKYSEAYYNILQRQVTEKPKKSK